VSTVTPVNTTIGPVGSFMQPERNMPVEALMAPKTALRSEYLSRSALRFFVVAAGTTTRKPASPRSYSQVINCAI
jgi:hypothetical protein